MRHQETKTVAIRLTEIEYTMVDQLARAGGCRSVSEAIRDAIRAQYLATENQRAHVAKAIPKPRALAAVRAEPPEAAVRAEPGEPHACADPDCDEYLAATDHAQCCKAHTQGLDT